MQSRNSNPATDAALAALLDLHASTICRWRKVEGAPTGRNLEEWKAFLAERGGGVAPTRVSPRREGLLCERLEVALERERFALQQDRKLLVERAAVDAALFRYSRWQRDELYRAMEQELPAKLPGLSIAEIRAELRKTADRICDIMHEYRETFKTDETKTAEPDEKEPV